MAALRTPAGTSVAGIDRWRGGWIVALLTGRTLRLEAAATTSEALEVTDGCAVVAVDMPMALPIRGRREAEAELRGRLGRAGSSVFISPTRAAIMAPDRAAATDVNRAHDGPGISAQAWGLAASVRELRETLPGHAAFDRWFETHPETAFAELNGGEPMASKKSALGVAQRLQALRPLIPGLDDLLLQAPEKVPVDDVLDAMAACWSAARIENGTELVLGAAGRDDEGFEQSIRI